MEVLSDNAIPILNSKSSHKNSLGVDIFFTFGVHKEETALTECDGIFFFHCTNPKCYKFLQNHMDNMRSDCVTVCVINIITISQTLPIVSYVCIKE